MRCMQVLDYLNNYFSKISTFQKIEMYLIPVIIALLLVYNFPKLQKKVITNINKVNQDVYFYEIEKQKILKKINFSHNIKVVKDIQAYAKKIELSIIVPKVKKNALSIEAEGELKQILQFLQFSENYQDFSKIENLIMTKIPNSLNIKIFLDLSFAQVIRSKKSESLSYEISNVKNPFASKVIIPLPKLYAIVNDHVLINNKWLQVGEHFDVYTITKIDLDFVTVESNGNVSVLRLFEE